MKTKERCPFCRQLLSRKCRKCGKYHCTSATGRGCVPLVQCDAKSKPSRSNVYETTPQGFKVLGRTGFADGPAELDKGPMLTGTVGQVR